jgi:hypothetical protein
MRKSFKGFYAIDRWHPSIEFEKRGDIRLSEEREEDGQCGEVMEDAEL